MSCGKQRLRRERLRQERLLQKWLQHVAAELAFAYARIVSLAFKRATCEPFASLLMKRATKFAQRLFP